ncbi:MAG: hypothetical protein ACYTEX_28540 [Planctomycetota bacterium]|jgi:hypothetical protein
MRSRPRNYRIVRYADGSGFGLHEVHYNEGGKVTSMTVRPVGFTGDTVEEVRGTLMMARMDAVRRPVFQEPPEWAERRSEAPSQEP